MWASELSDRGLIGCCAMGDIVKDIKSWIERVLRIRPGQGVQAAVHRVERAVDAPDRIEKLAEKTLTKTLDAPDKLGDHLGKDLKTAQKKLAKGDIGGATRAVDHAVKAPKRAVKETERDLKRLAKAPEQEKKKAVRAVEGLVKAPGREVKAAERSVKRIVKDPVRGAMAIKPPPAGP